MASTNELPEGFLESPAPNLNRSNVDFVKGGIPENEGAWAVVLDGVMTADECATLVAAAEATTNGTWERALVNIGGGMQAMYEDTRKCGRIIWDNREIMAKLWARIEASVPEIHRLHNWASVTGDGPSRRKETWNMTRLNERGRYLKYVGGEYFKAHCDGSYETPDGTERSYFTLHLYLNDAVDKDGQQLFEGGATTFYSRFMEERMDIVPRCGRVLLFQHRNLVHSGDDVIRGTKLTLRTDVMYALADEEDAAMEAK
ncbi:oxidoreductase domain-containing protein [Clathrospora elynae]|uniref:Oxidoreductase domain-containing protein n=1 Tax=Clathrospora elynae TaxID=706981 RepID=A0A6A5T3M0_9PLEO|nr:oxidoreductase domain-containing protein [Clathrospora elynae]